MTPAEELVHLEVAAGTATITLDSPANRNALSAQLRRELAAHLAVAAADDAVRVIVLTHTGPVFCSGMDLRETGTGAPGVGDFPAILQAVWTSATPVVARLAGPARAGGVGLVAACDIAVAARTGADGRATTFAFSEVRLGLVPAVISTTVLPRLLPRPAHELLLTGETFDADRAVAVGLLDRAVEHDELDAEVARYTDMLARGAPGALAATKELLRRTPADDVGVELAAMQELSDRFFAGDEGREGMAAFAQKRPASWVPPERG